MRPALRPLAAACLATALAAPAAADTAMLNVLIRDLDAAGGGGLNAAVGVCLLGDGDAEAAAAIWEGAGWRRRDTAGSIALSGSGAPYVVQLSQAERSCTLLAREGGSDAALQALVVAAMMTAEGFSGGPDTPAGCQTMRVGRAMAEVTSARNEAQCYDDDTARIHMTFPAN